jgi:hypothetical protein
VTGSDVYDEQYNTYPSDEAAWQVMLTEPYGLDWLASFAAQNGKPITIPERGVVNDRTASSGGDDRYFIDQMAHEGDHLGSPRHWSGSVRQPPPDFGTGPAPDNAQPGLTLRGGRSPW